MSYTKKTWVNGEIITADGLNNMEEGIVEAKKAAEAVVVSAGNAQTSADDAKAAAGEAAGAAVAAANAAQKNLEAHNSDTEAHADLRIELLALANRINAVLDSDDITLDELSEIVAYIKSNKTLIDAITVNKVNVADVVDNLVTSVSDKPLSAAQGVVLKLLTDSLQTQVDGKSPSDHGHTLTSLSGTLSIAKGGTGATTAANALRALGLTATAAELNYMKGATGNVQTQLDNKLGRTATAVTASRLATARNIKTDLGSSEAALFDGTVNVTPGVTGTLPIANGGTGATTAAAALQKLGLTATAVELNYMDGVTGNVQTQLDGKSPSSHNHTLTNLSGTLSIAKGGTGATTAAAARKNLGIYVQADEPTDAPEGSIWIKLSK